MHTLSHSLIAAAKAYNIRQMAPIMRARHNRTPYDLEKPTLEEEAGLLILSSGGLQQALYMVRFYHAHNTCQGQECVSWASLEELLEDVINKECPVRSAPDRPEPAQGNTPHL